MSPSKILSFQNHFSSQPLQDIPNPVISPMTKKQFKELEDNLWASANALRAYGGWKASDYALPVLELIFLGFADNKYSITKPKLWLNI